MTSVSDDIRVWAAPDGSRAVIQHLSAVATREDVKFALLEKKVVSGILWDNIDRAMKDASASRAPVQNIEAARAQAAEPVYDLCGNPYDRNGMEKLVAGLVDFGVSLGGPQEGRAAEAKGVFVSRRGTFLRMEQGAEGTTIFGTPLKKPPLLRFPAADSATISVRKYHDSIDYIALISGYLACSCDKGLFIADPIIISPDKMKMDFMLAPVFSGKEELIDFFFNKRFENDTELLSDVVPERKEIATIIERGPVSIIPLHCGRKPLPGIEGKLDFFIGVTQSGDTGVGKDSRKIDYRERTPFHEVTQGTTIAELILSRPGVPGRDVLGAELPVDPVHEVHFEAGKNVTVVNKDGRLFCIAAISGVAILTGEGVTVSPELKIQGDVGPETGNLHLGKSVAIVVGGIVTGGYKIVCGGNLEIHGHVENGAIIECKGKLTIKKGLLGLNTQCVVHGDAYIGFIQESVLRVGGNLTVESYIYNSKVLCRGELLVRGTSVTGEDRGAVIGGQVCSMASMTLHSVGSPAVKTELLSGVDSETLAALKEAKIAEPVLARKIQMLQSSLGVNIHDPSVVEKLRSMPLLVRSKLKERIGELKHLIINHDAIANALPLLEKKAFSPDAEKLSIKIQNRLTPDVLFRIGNAVKLCMKSGYRIKFKMDEGRIVELEL